MIINNLSTKEKVLIEMGSDSIGDCVAWIPYVEEFRKKNDCEVYCLTDRNNLYENSYPDIKFIEGKDKEKYTFDKKHKIGWYDDTPKEVKNKAEHGDCNVPLRFKMESQNLGSWLVNQRQYYRRTPKMTLLSEKFGARDFAKTQFGS